MHRVRQTWAEIRIGAEVAIDGIDFVCRVTGKEAGMLYLEIDVWYDVEFPVQTTHDCVGFERYCHTYLLSPDNLRVEPKVDWSAMEAAYGINHLGSLDTEPVRSLALRILKGDLSAYALVKDVL